MRAYKALFVTSCLCSGVVLASLAAPAWAQSVPAGPTQSSQPGQPGAAPATKKSDTSASASDSGGAVGEVVVTGSRIKTTTFNSPDPLTVITAEQAELTGGVDTAQILQLSAVAANATQINNYFTGFVTTGGPGVNTLSLRGLGADRTLFLIDGQRLGPAGVGGTVGPIDLNTIPESMIDRIEILKDGASSIYGSDAVAGVVNIITKTNQDGGEIHVFANPSEAGGGELYQVNGSWGKTFDKGYISVGFDYYRQNELRLSQRPYLNCSRDLVTANGRSADIIDPATGKDKCFNEIANAVEDLDSYTPVYRASSSAVAGGGLLGTDLNGWQNVGLTNAGLPTPVLSNAEIRASHGLEPEDNPEFDRNDAVSPVSRYTFTFFGGYDINPHAQAYASVMLNQRDSAQNSYDQFFVEPVNPFNQFNTAGFGYPVPIIQQAAPATQTVDYGRFVVGVKGDLPNFANLSNWTYDVYGQFSRSDGSYTQEYQKTDRVNATAGIDPNNPTAACSVNAFVGGGPNFFGGAPGPGNETMAMAEPGVACVPVNYLRAAALGYFQPNEYAFLYTNERGHTTYDQEYVEGTFTGNVFTLPAGPVGAAVGFHIRREAIDDVPGQDFINNNVYNYSTSGITKGAETVEEGFGELKVPIVKDLPFIYALNVDLSGRYSNYSDFGGQGTYKGTFDWKVTDWLAGRATYGTAFRAPALYELYLGNQTGYYGQVGTDPCIDYATSGVSPVIQKNCAAQGIPGTYSAANASSITVLSGGGAGHLKPETAQTETVGILLTPSFGDRHLNLSIDYYSYDIDNQIAQFGAGNILTQCYGATNFPNNPFCSLFTRDLSPGPSEYAITQINDDYVNLNKELDQGIDVTLEYRTQLPRGVKLTTIADLTWTLYSNTFLLGGSTDNYLGTIGYPRFDGNIDWRFDYGQWTFNWEVYMIGHSSDNPFTSTTIPGYRGTTETVTANYVTPFYTTSSISLQRRFDKYTVDFGVKNLFNQAPPAISYDDSFEAHNIGVSPAAVSQYDLIGRSYYVGITAKF
jgi:iron complex outermembrane receptor protein